MAFGLFLQNPDNTDLWTDASMDLVYDESGHLVSLTGLDKVRHHILKGILTGPAVNWGTTVPLLIGSKQTDLVMAAAASSVIDLVGNIADSQASNLPDNETVDSVSSIKVAPLSADPTTLQLSVTVAVVSGDLVEVEHRFSPR